MANRGAQLLGGIAHQCPRGRRVEPIEFFVDRRDRGLDGFFVVLVGRVDARLRSLSRKMSHFLSRFLFEIDLLSRWFAGVQIDGFFGLPVADWP